MKALGLQPPRIFAVVQHSKRFKLEDRYGKLLRFRELKQGENMLSFYRQDTSNADTEPLSGAAPVESDLEISAAALDDE